MFDLNVLEYDSVTGYLSELTITQFIICVFSALIIGFAISLLYLYTHKKEGFAQSYALTVIMLPPIVCILLMLVSTTAGGLALAGVFTLCRFRSMPADPKDVTYVFLAMACGVICGKGYVVTAFVFFILLAIVMYVLYVINYAAPKASDMTLKISIPENMNYEGLFDSVLNKYTTTWKLRRVKTTNFGSLFDCIYAIQLPHNVDQKKFIDELRTLNGNMTITLTLFRYEDRLYEK